MNAWTVAVGAVLLGIATGVGITAWQLSGGTYEGFENSGGVHSPPLEAGESRAIVTVVNGEVYEFDTMEHGETESHAFLFRNVGNAPLKLVKGETSCKCTLSNLTNGELQPNETTEVVLEWTPKGDDVDFHQTATIRTSDPDRPEVTLSVMGRIVHTIMPKPRIVTLSNVSGNEARKTAVGVFCFRDSNFKLTGHELLNPETAEFFDVSFEPMSEAEVASEVGAKGGVVVHITMKPGLPLGPINQTILLTNNLKNVPELAIPIRGMVSGDISFFAGRNFDHEHNLVTLGRVSRNEGAKIEMQMLVRGPYRKGIEFSIGNVVPDTLEVSIGEAKEINKGMVYSRPFTIEIPKDSRPVNHLGPQQSKMGTIVIQTTHPKAKELTLYVKFAVE